LQHQTLGTVAAAAAAAAAIVSKGSKYGKQNQCVQQRH